MTEELFASKKIHFSERNTAAAAENAKLSPHISPHHGDQLAQTSSCCCCGGGKRGGEIKAKLQLS